MKNPINLSRFTVAKTFEGLKDRAARIKADGLPNVASRMKRPDLSALRERAAQLKFPAIKVPDLKLRDLKLPEFKRPGTAGGMERFKAAKDGDARQVTALAGGANGRQLGQAGAVFVFEHDAGR